MCHRVCMHLNLLVLLKTAFLQYSVYHTHLFHFPVVTIAVCRPPGTLSCYILFDTLSLLTVFFFFFLLMCSVKIIALYIFLILFPLALVLLQKQHHMKELRCHFFFHTPLLLVRQNQIILICPCSFRCFHPSFLSSS